MQKRKECSVSDCTRIGYKRTGLCSKHLVEKCNSKGIDLMYKQYNLRKKGYQPKASNEIKAKIQFEKGLVIARETGQRINAKVLFSLATLDIVQGDKISAREHATTILENSDAGSREIELTKQFLKSLN